jgi:hypothetical protein
MSNCISYIYLYAYMYIYDNVYLANVRYTDVYLTNRCQAQMAELLALVMMSRNVKNLIR